MGKRKHLIIGSGIAALNALEKIRSSNGEDEVRLITRENYPPHSIAALPYLVAGRIKEADFWLKDEGYFRKMKASLDKGKEVVSILPGQKQVRYRDGSSDAYDTLLIASGSKPVIPPVKGLKETDSLTFHTMTDYQRLVPELKTDKEVAIYGGGLIATELAIALLERGCRVKLIARSRLLRRYFDEEISTEIEDNQQKQGGQIHRGSEIGEARRKKGKTELTLTDGSLLHADNLVIAVGVAPAISFLEGCGIKANTGIITDRQMQTNLPGIFAAGDVAEARDFFDQETGLNPILPGAIRQGKVAGANMAGGEVVYEGWLSMNVLRFFGHVVCAVGLAGNPAGQVLREKDDRKKQIKEMVFQNDKLVGARFLDVDIDPGIIRYLIEKRLDIGKHQELLFARPRETSRWLALENEKRESTSLTSVG